jgi:LPXTG-motif cell wall-anchored protein
MSAIPPSDRQPTRLGAWLVKTLPAGTWRRDTAVALFMGSVTAVFLLAFVLLIDLPASGGASPPTVAAIAGLWAIISFLGTLRRRRRGERV